MKIKQGLLGPLLRLVNINKANDSLNNFLLQKMTTSVSMLFIFSILKNIEVKILTVKDWNDYTSPKYLQSKLASIYQNKICVCVPWISFLVYKWQEWLLKTGFLQSEIRSQVNRWKEMKPSLHRAEGKSQAVSTWIYTSLSCKQYTEQFLHPPQIRD